MFPLSVFKRVKMKGKDIPYKMFTFFTILYPSSIFNNYKIIRLLLLFWPSDRLPTVHRLS